MRCDGFALGAAQPLRLCGGAGARGRGCNGRMLGVLGVLAGCAGCWVCWVLGAGCWVLGVLGAGCAGCWVPGAGCWVLDAACCVDAPFWKKKETCVDTCFYVFFRLRKKYFWSISFLAFQNKEKVLFENFQPFASFTVTSG